MSSSPGFAASVSQMRPEEIQRKLQTLLIHTMGNFDQFLFYLNCNREKHELIKKKFFRVKANLDSLLGQILKLISYLPNAHKYLRHAYDVTLNSDVNQVEDILEQIVNIVPQFDLGTERKDIYAALLYSSAHLIKHLLDPTINLANRSESQVYVSALALCKVAACVGVIDPGICGLLKRSLFWTGLILTRSTYPLSKLSF